MKKTGFLIPVLFVISMVLNIFGAGAQDIDWLAPYTAEVNAGSYIYKYGFTAVDNNTCKLKIDEQKTDKKGKTSSDSYILYISDINPSSLSFKASGKVIEVNMETRLSQKFITVFEEGEFKGYTNKITISMDEVDKARSFIEVIKSHIDPCQKNERTWSSVEEAFTWLANNIGVSEISGTTYKQSFSKGAKSYLAQLKTEKTDSRGNTQTETYIFDLSDIDHSSIAVDVSGSELTIELPVRDNKYFIQVLSADGSLSYSKGMEIHADDIEQARNISNALSYLVSNTRAERKEWTSYSQALTYVKENLREVKSGSSSYAQSVSFGTSPSDKVSFRSVITDSKGTSSEELSEIYLNDLVPAAELNVSSGSAYISLESRDKNKYIRQIIDGNTGSYANSLKIYVEDIDNARDMAGALEYAINNSKSGVIEFASAEKAIEWLRSGTGEVNIDSKNIKQTLRIAPELENKLELLVVTTDEGSTPVNERYEIYPGDLSVEDLEIKVSGKKLYVPLSTGKLKYIKVFKENELQNFSSSADVYFEDVLKAKNFISAVKFIHEKSMVRDRLQTSESAAWDYLSSHLKKIETSGTEYEQELEKVSDNCKLKFTRIETDSKGESTEYVYEFNLKDIDAANSGLVVSSSKLYLNLVTTEKQKFIKTYKNGEAGNFVYDFDLFVDDILVAKNMLGAFSTLMDSCK
jgi:hypothetical protein